MQNSLYFIALVPPQELQDEITVIKKQFGLEYHCRHALKTFPHVTLQPPFKRMPQEEIEIHLQLQDFFGTCQPFDVALKNYGCFANRQNKVIYIAVAPDKTLTMLHGKLVHLLRSELKFSEKEASYMFHPHITVAHRDLPDDDFEKAWSIYKDKIFEASFTANKVQLLKHNYRQWQVLGEFGLGQ